MPEPNTSPFGLPAMSAYPPCQPEPIRVLLPCVELPEFVINACGCLINHTSVLAEETKLRCKRHPWPDQGAPPNGADRQAAGWCFTLYDMPGSKGRKGK